MALLTQIGFIEILSSRILLSPFHSSISLISRYLRIRIRSTSTLFMGICMAAILVIFNCHSKQGMSRNVYRNLSLSKYFRISYISYKYTAYRWKIFHKHPNFWNNQCPFGRLFPQSTRDDISLESSILQIHHEWFKIFSVTLCHAYVMVKIAWPFQISCHGYTEHSDLFGGSSNHFKFDQTPSAELSIPTPCQYLPNQVEGDPDDCPPRLELWKAGCMCETKNMWIFALGIKCMYASVKYSIISCNIISYHII